MRRFGLVVKRQTEILLQESVLLRSRLLRERALEDLVRDIAYFDADIVEPELVAYRGAELGYDLTVARVAIVIGLVTPFGAEQVSERLAPLSTLRGRFASAQDIVAAMPSDRFVVLHRVPSAHTTDDLLAQCRDTVEEIRRRHGLIAAAGLGDAARSIAGLHESYQDASIALRLGVLLDHAPGRPPTVSSINDLRMHQLLAAAGHRPRARLRDGLLAALRAAGRLAGVAPDAHHLVRERVQPGARGERPAHPPQYAHLPAEQDCSPDRARGSRLSWCLGDLSGLPGRSARRRGGTIMTETLEVPGAVLQYDVREGTSATEPVLMMVGSPMDATGFATLAEHFPDRTVVTYDPRGSGRSRRTQAGVESTPEQHADDLHRVIDAVGRGPVDLFATSGGAINALALVARHPEQVRTLVAHEPPAGQVLPDRDAALAAVVDIRRTYERAGSGAAMAKFIAVTGHRGEIPADFAEQPVDPAAFGMPTEDDGTRDDVLFAQNLITCTHFEPDFDALRAAPTRIVLAIGAESEDQLCWRAGKAVADRLGSTAVVFPSHHAGFAGGEFGMKGDPDGFAAALRDVL